MDSCLYSKDILGEIIDFLHDTDKNSLLQSNKQKYLLYNHVYRQISLSFSNSLKYLYEQHYRQFINLKIVDPNKQLTLNLQHINCNQKYCEYYFKYTQLNLSKVYMNGCNFYSNHLMETAFTYTGIPFIVSIEQPSQLDIIHKLKYFCDKYEHTYSIDKDTFSSFITLTPQLYFIKKKDNIEIYLDKYTKDAIRSMEYGFNKCLDAYIKSCIETVDNKYIIRAKLNSMPEHILVLKEDLKPIGLIEYYKTDGNIYDDEVELMHEGTSVFGLTLYVPYRHNTFHASITCIYSDNVVKV